MPNRSQSTAKPLRPEAETVPESTSAQERKECMKLVLSALSARDREALIRFYWKEQSEDQICTELGIAQTVFRDIKSRAKARFAELIRN